MISIIPAYDGEALEYVITLAQEYITWMLAEIRATYPQLNTALFASEHDYDDVRKKFPGDHVPPDGRLLLATHDDQVCGCIALARLSADICEVRTLFVRPVCRGTGVGKLLVQACLDEAREIGCRYARLDTLGFMQGAQSLYRSFGFRDIPPYLDLPDELKPYILFLELDLAN